jgi:Fe/S biogenesis protein NfuA
VINFDSFDVYTDPDSAGLLEDATVDYVEQLMGSGFKIDRPMQSPEHLSGPVVDQVKAVLEEQINPMVAGHGGHIALLDIKEDVVYVELQGGCQGCGMADVTLKQGIESAITEAVPAIKSVLDVTDHANGKNPYYKS